MDPLIGMIVPFPYFFVPRGWLACEGQVVAIQQYQALFSLIGTQFGGNGSTTFGLPDLRGRAPVGQGNGPGLAPVVVGQSGGQQSVTLTVNQMPAHSHPVAASGTPTSKDPSGLLPATTSDSAAGAEVSAYGTPASTTMAGNMVGPAGGNQPVDILNPYLGMRYCIAFEGIYPSRN